MKEILLINPSSRGKTKGTKMAKKKKTAKKNPSARAAISRAKATFMGLNFDRVLKDMPSIQLGMFAAKWAAKRFGGGATETDPESWTWSSYLKGALGAVAAAAVAQNVRRGTGQKVLEGGLNLMAYEMVQKELIPRSGWATGQFGQDEYEPGDVAENDAGEPFLLGENGQWYPVDERHRMPEMADDLETPGRLGDDLETPGRLGADADPYAAAFFGGRA